ncbi:MAG: carboxypeptidase-like regulatory domain-containing protein, partial [Mucilaginibacter sp.]
MRYHIPLFILSMLLCLSSYAQTLSISGKVTDADNAEPLIGVSIKVKGTVTGALTAMDGSYVIMAKPGDILVFSYLSFTSQEITVKQSSVINVKLNSTSSNLNEVV